MQTFNWTKGWLSLVEWNALGFVIAFFLNSFIEWAAHRWILHSPKILKFPYELHHIGHHGMFKSDETYHAQNEEMRDHIRFVPRDYFLFLLFTTPIWLGIEIVIERPFFIGGVLATLSGLQLFNSLHWRYHVPSDTRFQRTKFFLFMKAHHRAHHGDTSKNYNVSFLPIADRCLGTLKKNTH